MFVVVNKIYKRETKIYIHIYTYIHTYSYF